MKDNCDEFIRSSAKGITAQSKPKTNLTKIIKYIISILSHYQYIIK